MSKPKKVKESASERASKEVSLRQARTGDRIQSKTTAASFNLANMDVTQRLKSKANADVNQSLAYESIKVDPSGGAAVNFMGDTESTRSNANLEQQAVAEQSADMASHQLKSNAIASVAGTTTSSNAKLSNLASIETNAAIGKQTLKTQKNKFLFDLAGDAIIIGRSEQLERKAEKDAMKKAKNMSDAAKLRRFNNG